MDYSLCSSGKIAYDSEYEAEEALIQSCINFTHGAVNFYRCTMCACYHLTSQGEKHAVFYDEEVKKRIERERSANRWKF